MKLLKVKMCRIKQAATVIQRGSNISLDPMVVCAGLCSLYIKEVNALRIDGNFCQNKIKFRMKHDKQQAVNKKEGMLIPKRKVATLAVAPMARVKAIMYPVIYSSDSFIGSILSLILIK